MKHPGGWVAAERVFAGVWDELWLLAFCEAFIKYKIKYNLVFDFQLHVYTSSMI